MQRGDLAVGEEARGAARVAIFASLGLVCAFVGLTWLTKEIPALNVRQPWQDDPYDVLVSLDFSVLPCLVAAAALRVQLCRRNAPLPVRRLVDLTRVCGAAVGACLATDLAEWFAVGLGLHRAEWTMATAWQVGALLISTVAMVVAGGLLVRVSRAVTRVASAEAQPDWLADIVAFGLAAAGRLRGRADAARGMVRWGEAQLVDRVRRHPMIAAAVLAGLLALPYVAAKTLLEGYPPALVLLSFALPSAALFALIVLVGRYLRIVAPTTEPPSVGVSAAVVACIAGTVTFALHDSLLPQHQTAAELNGLLFGGAAAGYVAGLVIALTRRRAHAGESRGTEQCPPARSH